MIEIPAIACRAMVQAFCYSASRRQYIALAEASFPHDALSSARGLKRPTPLLAPMPIAWGLSVCWLSGSTLGLVLVVLCVKDSQSPL